MTMLKHMNMLDMDYMNIKHMLENMNMMEGLHEHDMHGHTYCSRNRFATKQLKLRPRQFSASL